jgi:hypothetical protein
MAGRAYARVSAGSWFRDGICVTLGALISRGGNGNSFHILYPLILRASTSFTRRSGLIEHGFGYLRIITRVSPRLRRNSRKVAAAALLYLALAPGAGASDGSSLTSFVDPATQAPAAELQEQIANVPAAAPESQAPAVESQAPAVESQAPAGEPQAPAAETQAPAVDPTAAIPPATTATLHPEVAPIADVANSVKENSGHEFAQSSLKRAVSLGSHSVIPTPETRPIPPAGAPAAGQENKAPIRRLIASGIKQAKHGKPSAWHGSFSNAKSRMNTGSPEVERSNSQPRTEAATPRQHAVPRSMTTRVKSHPSITRNQPRQGAEPQYHRGNTQYRAAERLVQRVGPSAEVWFATRSGGVDAWLGQAGTKFDWPRINTFATNTAIGAIAVGARAETARDTTAGSPDHPRGSTAAIGHAGGGAARASGAGSAGSAGSNGSAATQQSATAARTAALATPPPTRAAPKRLAARHEPPVRELSDSRLMLQLGLLLGLVYLAFVIAWLLARRSRPRIMRRGLRA